MAVPTHFKMKALAAAMAFGCSAPAWSVSLTNVTLSGDYVQIGTNEYGTLGSGGNTSPGILYDSTGTGTFNTGYDYLTPGTPFEGFTVQATDSGGVTYTVSSNNSGGLGSGLTGVLTDESSGTYQGVSWSGSYSSSGSTLFDIVNTVGFDESEQQVTLTTTITAAEDLTDIYFARYTDPDVQAEPGDSSATNNVRGNGEVDGTNLVYAEALSSKMVIGLYTDASTNSNTGVSSGWSQDPKVYYAGPDDGQGDYTVGVAFYTAELNADGSVTFTYYYIFGSDIAAAVSQNVSTETLSVLESALVHSNSPAYAGARIIDATPELLELFTNANLGSDTEVSDAASQTLPLLTGSGSLAVRSALNGMNGAVQARQNAQLGLSSGDAMLQDQHIWLKPFGTWTEQDDRNGVSGYDAETGGLILGLDSTIGTDLQLGLAFAWSTTNVESTSDSAPQSLDIDSYQLIGYGSLKLDQALDLTFQADIGQNHNDGERYISLTNATAYSDYDSYTAHLGLGLVRSYRMTESNRATAGVTADYTWIRDDSYEENGADLLNLDVDSTTTEALVLGLEGKLYHSLSESTELNAGLGVGYDLINENASVTASYAGAAGAQFTTEGLDPSPWNATAGLGLVHTADNGAEISANYAAEYRSDYLSQSASLKLRLAF